MSLVFARAQLHFGRETRKDAGSNSVFGLMCLSSKTALDALAVKLWMKAPAERRLTALDASFRTSCGTSALRRGTFPVQGGCRQRRLTLRSEMLDRSVSGLSRLVRREEGLPRGFIPSDRLRADSLQIPTFAEELLE